MTHESPHPSPADQELTSKIARLRAVRHALGWSEETCAHALGVTYSTLSRWEHGHSLPRSRVMVEAIDRFLAAHSTGREE